MIPSGNNSRGLGDRSRNEEGQSGGENVRNEKKNDWVEKIDGRQKLVKVKADLQ